MKILFTLLLSCLSVLAAPGSVTPSFKSFNTNQFSSNNFIISVKPGALFTNLNINSSTFTFNGTLISNIVQVGGGGSGDTLWNNIANVATLTNTMEGAEISHNVANGDDPSTYLDIHATVDGTFNDFSNIYMLVNTNSVQINMTTDAGGVNTSALRLNSGDGSGFILLDISGTNRVLFNPAVASGSAVAHILDTSNVLTNGDTFLSIRNQGTEALSIQPSSTGSQLVFGPGLSPKIIWNATTNTVFDTVGVGTPEGVVTASPGATYRNYSGGASTTVYVKESGAGNTGWVALGSGGGGDSTWTNVANSGYVTMIPGQTATNTLAFVSGAADNATNTLFSVDSANYLSAPGTLLGRFGNDGTNRTSISSYGGIGVGPTYVSPSFNGPLNPYDVLVSYANVADGDDPTRNIVLSSQADSSYTFYSELNLNTTTGLTTNNVALLTLESNAAAQYAYWGLQSGTGDAQSFLEFTDSSSTPLRLNPTVASSGTAVAYLFDTANFLNTEGDLLVKFRNDGTNVLQLARHGEINIGYVEDLFGEVAQNGETIFSVRDVAKGDSPFNRITIAAWDSNNSNLRGQSDLIVETNTAKFLLDIASGNDETVLEPSVVSTGSAVAYIFDTSNTLTNGDSFASIRNAGTEIFGLRPNAAGLAGGQMVWGPGSSNVLYRSGSNLVYTNGNLSGYSLQFVDPTGGVDVARYGVSGSGNARITTSTGKAIYLSPDNESIAYVAQATAFGPSALNASLGTSASNGRWLNLHLDNDIRWNGTTNNLKDTWGIATPEGAESAAPGSLFRDTANGKIYKKSTGTGNTGWEELAAGGGGGGDTIWTNISGVVTMLPGQAATNRVAFTSGAANNATNRALIVDTAATWSFTSGAHIADFNNFGTNQTFIRPDGAVFIGRATPTMGSPTVAQIAQQINRQRNLGDNATAVLNITSSADDSFTDSASIDLTAVSDATNPQGDLVLAANDSGGGTTSISLLSRANANDAINMTIDGTARLLFKPAIASSGSADAYIFDTVNTLTNADNNISIRTTGTEQAYVTPLGYYVSTKGSAYLAANATSTSTTMANLGLSATVNNAKKYTFKCIIYCADSVAADGAKFDFDGGTATATNFRVHGTAFDTALVLSTQSTALATDFAAATVTGDAMFEFHGSFEPSASGTFIPRFAQNATTAGTLTAYRGSSLILTEAP